MGRKKGKRYGKKQGNLLWERDAAAVEKAAKKKGMTLRVSVQRRKDGTVCGYHVMFDDAQGRRILNYWPSKGTVWFPTTNRKATIPYPLALLEDFHTAPEMKPVKQPERLSLPVVSPIAPAPSLRVWAIVRKDGGIDKVVFGEIAAREEAQRLGCDIAATTLDVTSLLAPDGRGLAPFLAWFDSGEGWQHVFSGQSEDECLFFLSGYSRRGRCFVTRGEEPEVFFRRLDKERAAR